jgi:two-component system KDP operon response regulator KdpE
MSHLTRRILIVEDDPAVRRVVAMLFETNGFRVFASDTYPLAVQKAQEYQPDMCVVDVDRPDRDALGFITRLRTEPVGAVIALSTRMDKATRRAAFDAGADDYVIKPFYGPEFLERVRAVVRRMFRNRRPGTLLRLGNVVIDRKDGVLRGPRGELLRMTPLEQRVFECLVERADGVVTQAQMLRQVWGENQGNAGLLRVCMAGLRRKLEADSARPRHILTETGVGYRLATAPEPVDSFESLAPAHF